MRPNLYRGQAPAKGILHVQQRVPVRARTDADGKVYETADPRGYWLGQHTTSQQRRNRRAQVSLMGIRQYKKAQRAGERGRRD